MKQKTTWMRYLIFGISFCFTLLFSSCGETIVEYRLDADIIYKNESNHLIKYYQYDSENNQKVFVFELEANSEKKYQIRSSGPDTNINNCCQGILEGFQGINSILIDYDNSDKCLIYTDGEGSTTGNISTYESREIESRYYEFIYTFTEAEYNLATDCN